MSPLNTQSNLTFHGLGIAPGLLEVLARLRFVTPTPIQYQAIPPAMEGKDVVGVAQTGTGKTLAFGIPMLQLLAREKGRGLILLPTRELALQVEEELHKIGRPLGLKTAVLIGGAAMRPQLQALGNRVLAVRRRDRHRGENMLLPRGRVLRAGRARPLRQ